MNFTCYLAQFSADPCDGRMDRAHWIPKQRLRHQGLSDDAIWDRRVWSPICRAHHHLLDNGFLRLTQDQLPAAVFEYADEHGLRWSIERDFA